MSTRAAVGVYGALLIAALGAGFLGYCATAAVNTGHLTPGGGAGLAITAVVTVYSLGLAIGIAVKAEKT